MADEEYLQTYRIQGSNPVLRIWRRLQHGPFYPPPLRRQASRVAMDFLAVEEEDVAEEAHGIEDLAVYCCDLHCGAAGAGAPSNQVRSRAADDAADDEEEREGSSTFTKDSARNLISTLESLGTRSARRLSQSIARHSQSYFTPGKQIPDINTIYEEEDGPRTIDDVIERINPLGRFQKFIILMIICGAAPIIGTQTYLLKTQSLIPPWRCKMGLHTPTCNATTCAVTPNTTCHSRVDYSYSEYHVNNSEVLCSLRREEWEWVDVLYNAVAQWDIPCSPAKILLDMIYFIPGGMIGGVIGGRMCDRLGRRLSFLLFMVATLASGTLISSSKYLVSYLTLRLITGISVTALHLCNYIWILEHFSFSSRNVVAFLYFGGTHILVPVISILHYSSLSWNYVHFFSIGSLLTGVFIFFYVPESPRWLILEGDRPAMERILRSVASINSRIKDYACDLSYGGGSHLQASPHAQSRDRDTWCEKEVVFTHVLWGLCVTYRAFIQHLTSPLLSEYDLNEAITWFMGIPLLIGLAFIPGVSLKRGLILLTLLSFCFLVTIVRVIAEVVIPMGGGGRIVTMVTDASYHVAMPCLVAVVTLWVFELMSTEKRASRMGLLLSTCSVVQGSVSVIFREVLTLDHHGNGHTAVVLELVGLVLVGVTFTVALFLRETAGRTLTDFECEEKTGELIYEILAGTIRKVLKFKPRWAKHRRRTEPPGKLRTWPRLSPILF